MIDPPDERDSVAFQFAGETAEGVQLGVDGGGRVLIDPVKRATEFLPSVPGGDAVRVRTECDEHFPDGELRHRGQGHYSSASMSPDNTA